MTKSRIPALLAAAALLLAACGTGTGGPQAAAPEAAAPVAAAAPAALPPPERCEPNDILATASLSPGSRTAAQLARTSAVQEIKRRGRLIVGTSGDVLLWGARDPKSGQLQGFDILLAQDIARVIFGTPADRPPPVEFRVINYAQRLPAVSGGKAAPNTTQQDSPLVDLVLHTMTINCERWKQIAFSIEYYGAGQRILVRSDNPKLDPKTGEMQITDLDEGTEICVPASSTNVELLEKEYTQFKPVTVPEIGECLVKFQRGEVGVITGDDTVLAGFAAQDPYAKVVGAPLSTEPYGIGVDRGKPDLVRFVNAVLEDVRGDRWAQIYTATMGQEIPKVPGMPRAEYGR
jgi:polar amino acid transport system substrate-binding protein